MSSLWKYAIAVVAAGLMTAGCDNEREVELETPTGEIEREIQGEPLGGALTDDQVQDDQVQMGDEMERPGEQGALDQFGTEGDLEWEQEQGAFDDAEIQDPEYGWGTPPDETGELGTEEQDELGTRQQDEFAADDQAWGPGTVEVEEDEAVLGDEMERDESLDETDPAFGVDDPELGETDDIQADDTFETNEQYGTQQQELNRGTDGDSAVLGEEEERSPGVIETEPDGAMDPQQGEDAQPGEIDPLTGEPVEGSIERGDQFETESDIETGVESPGVPGETGQLEMDPAESEFKHEQSITRSDRLDDEMIDEPRDDLAQTEDEFLEPVESDRTVEQRTEIYVEGDRDVTIADEGRDVAVAGDEEERQPMTRAPEQEPYLVEDIDDDVAYDPTITDDTAEGTPMGIGFMVGGGVNDYVNDFDESTDVGGNWEARAVLGTRSIVAGELAYHGTANDIDTLGLDDSAVLMSNGAEGALRINFLTEAVQPYVLGGVGWKHFNVVNTDTNTSNIADSDDALTVPVGAGIAYKMNNIYADLRGMYRPAFLADMVDDGIDEDTNLDTINGSLNVGFEF